MAVTYTPTTNFGAKDSLPQNDPDKVIKGSEFTTEFTALQTAFSLAAPNASPTFTGTVTIPTADINGGAIDGTVIGAVTPAAASFTTVSATGNITVGGTVDGRDVAADGTKLDGIEAGADVTDTTNVTAAGALMDSELTNIAAVKALNQGVATTDSPSFAGLTATGSVSLAGASTTADITFADNSKAIFGAGADLQIYHDGSNSYVADAGDGDLILRGSTGIKLQSGSGVLEYLSTNSSNGSVELKLSGATKLTTTATGIDVTGTVTADGLTVDGNVDVQSASTASLSLINTDTILSEGQITGAIDFYQSDSTSGGTGISAKIETESVQQTGAGSYYGTAADLNIRVSSGGAANNADLKAATFHHGGDISFYEDTGTTPKFFWDASAESLGIGTTSPVTALDVTGTINATTGFALTGNAAQVTTTYSGITTSRFYTSTSGLNLAVDGAWPLIFSNNSTERMRITSAGNVGIGTASVTNSRVQVKGANNTTTAYADGFKATSNNETVEVQYSWTGINANDTLRLATGGSERARIDSSGNVGIGSSTIDGYYGSSPANTRAVIAYSSASTNVDTAPKGLVVRNDNTTTSNLSQMVFGTLNTGNTPIAVASIYSVNDARTSGFSTGSLGFGTVGGSGIISERMRIDSSGNLLVGTTTANPTGLSNNTPGVELSATGGLRSSVDDDVSGTFNRKTNEGPLLLLRVDGDTKGIVGIAGSRPYLSNRINFSVKIDDFANGSFIPADEDGAASDNVSDIGSASARWDDIYATNGTIQTSDANEKQDIRDLSEAEARVAQAAKALLKAFRWKDSVAEKGDDARIHFGIIAQDLQAAFEAEGLDAGRYAMFIHSTWTDEETGEERSRMGVRYSELLAFIIAAL